MGHCERCGKYANLTTAYFGDGDIKERLCRGCFPIKKEPINGPIMPMIIQDIEEDEWIEKSLNKK